MTGVFLFFVWKSNRILSILNKDWSDAVMKTKTSKKLALGVSSVAVLGGVVAPLLTAPQAVEASTATYKTTTDLNMRSGASVNYKVVKTLKKGTKVTYVSKSGDWFKINADGKVGYVNSKYLVKEATPKAPVTPKATTPVKVTTPTVVQYKTTGDLNMRSGGSTAYKVVTVLKKGTVVNYVSTSGTWYKVTANGKTGYVSSSYLTKVGATVTPAKATTTMKYVDGILIANKQYGLPSTYAPGESPVARSAFNQMKAGASKSGISLTAFSGYRSYAYQTTLYNNYVRNYGQAQADRFSAKPGFSEHQTGLAFDIGGPNTAHWAEDSFANTKEAKWLASNAQKYGFILRYPKGKEAITGYMYESWHFRYVGKDLATKVKASGKTLEEYFNLVN